MKKLIVKAVVKNNHYQEFPYMNGVLWVLHGDSECLNNLQKELEVIKQTLNREANKHGLKYLDLKVTVKGI